MRVAGQIRRELAEIVQRGEIHDPRMGPVTITEIRCDDNLSGAKVFLLPSESSPDRIAEIIKVFEKAAGFLQGRIGRVLRLKRVPKLMFVYDDLYQKSAAMDALIDSLHPTPGGETDQESEEGNSGEGGPGAPPNA